MHTCMSNNLGSVICRDTVNAASSETSGMEFFYPMSFKIIYKHRAGAEEQYLLSNP